MNVCEKRLHVPDDARARAELGVAVGAAGVSIGEDLALRERCACELGSVSAEDDLGGISLLRAVARLKATRAPQALEEIGLFLRRGRDDILNLFDELPDDFRIQCSERHRRSVA